MRKDLCQQSDLFNAPLWRYEPPALQVSCCMCAESRFAIIV